MNEIEVRNLRDKAWDFSRVIEDAFPDDIGEEYEVRLRDSVLRNLADSVVQMLEETNFITNHGNYEDVLYNVDETAKSLRAYVVHTEGRSADDFADDFPS